MNGEEKAKEKLKEIVLMKIETMPINYKLSVGKEGVFNKEEIIEHVKKMDTIGEKILDMEFRFMKALSDGRITKALASV